MAQEQACYETAGTRSAVTRQPSAVGEDRVRVLALDLVRGVCAIGVAFYHILLWMGTAHLTTIGLYGVYIFFVVSGASLMLSYKERIRSVTDYGRFMVMRYARIAPLFTAVLVIYIAQQILVSRDNSANAANVLLNASLLFGFVQPGRTSIVTGGWSIGIEFIFYFIFPVILAALLYRRSLAVAVVLVVFAAQLIFVNHALGSDGDAFEQNWIAYTQVWSFLGYFMFGAGIGSWSLGKTRAPIPGAFVLGMLMLGTVFTWPVASPSDALTGGTGIILAVLSCFAVWILGYWSPKERWVPLVRLIADASYGTYLLHPIAFGLFKRIMPPPEGAAGFIYSAAIVSISMTGAVLIYRFIEKPLLRAVKTTLYSRKVAAQ